MRTGLCRPAMGWSGATSPPGTAVTAPDGSRQPAESEVATASHQGKHVAEVAKRLSG